MKNVLADYMRSRMEKKTTITSLEEVGPVVTISREYGCPSKVVAQDLCIKLNKICARKHKSQSWRWISKEILEESAKELKLDKSFVKKAVNAYEKGLMNDMIRSLSSRYYPGNDKVKKTLGDVIKGFAREGNVIIVGRAAVSLLRDIKNSLHVRLEAPFEWRVNVVSERKGISVDEARKLTRLVDAKRKKLQEFFGGKKREDSLFDVHYNYQSLTEDEILESIVTIMEMRNMI